MKLIGKFLIIVVTILCVVPVIVICQSKGNGINFAYHMKLKFKWNKNGIKMKLLCKLLIKSIKQAGAELGQAQ